MVYPERRRNCPNVPSSVVATGQSAVAAERQDGSAETSCEGGARPGHADIWGNSRVEKQNSESLADLQFLHNSEIEAVTRQVHL